MSLLLWVVVTCVAWALIHHEVWHMTQGDDVRLPKRWWEKL